MLWAAIVHLKLLQNILQCLDRIHWEKLARPGVAALEEMMSVQMCAGAGGCR